MCIMDQFILYTNYFLTMPCFAVYRCIILLMFIYALGVTNYLHRKIVSFRMVMALKVSVVLNLAP